jgi:hypothetical protein
VHGTAAVVHVREHQHGDLALQCRQNFFRLHQLHLVAALLAQALRDVQVGGKVAAFTENDAALRCVLVSDGEQ